MNTCQYYDCLIKSVDSFGDCLRNRPSFLNKSSIPVPVQEYPTISLPVDVVEETGQSKFCLLDLGLRYPREGLSPKRTALPAGEPGVFGRDGVRRSMSFKCLINLIFAMGPTLHIESTTKISRPCFSLADDMEPHLKWRRGDGPLEAVICRRALFVSLLLSNPHPAGTPSPFRHHSCS